MCIRDSSEAVVLEAADLRGVNLMGHFDFAHARGADFSGAQMAADMRNQSMGLIHTQFNSADLREARFTGAALGHVGFRFAHLEGADFRNAQLQDADFTGAYLAGADFTGAALPGAIFEGAHLEGVRGLTLPR